MLLSKCTTAAFVLAEHSPGAWAGEDWFYNQTKTGKLILRMRTVLKQTVAPMKKYSP
ncbi:MAG: hypothetical protein ACI9VI_000610 [Candidatus Azotimanducaceae bacterium]|jgi:hypothetical protein